MAWVAAGIAEAWTLETNSSGNVLSYVNTTAGGSLATCGAGKAAVANAGSGGLRSAAAANYSTDAATIGAFGPGAGAWTDAAVRNVRASIENDGAIGTAATRPTEVVSITNSNPGGLGELQVLVYNTDAANASGNVRVKLHYTAP